MDLWFRTRILVSVSLVLGLIGAHFLAVHTWAAAIDLGHDALSVGDWSRAIAQFDQAILEDAGDAAAYQGRGTAYGMMGKFDRAIADLTEAIRLDPTEATAYRTRGGFYALSSNYDAAINDCDKAMKLGLMDSATYSNRGFAHLCKGEMRKAVSDFNEAIRLDPSASRPYANRALAWHRDGIYDQALADLGEAIRLNGGTSDVFLLRADIHFRRGQLEKAFADVNEAIRAAPASSKTYQQRAAIRAQMGQLERALADFSEAIRLDPRSAMSYAGRATCLARQKQYEAAIADVDKSIALCPNSPCFYEARAALWINWGKHDRADADIDTFLRLNPADPAVAFEQWPKNAVTDVDIRHGEQQVERMLRDRPAMAQHGRRADTLYQWAARKFAGEDFGGRVFWDSQDPPPFTTCASYVTLSGETGAIRVTSKRTDGPAEGSGRTFEELWRDAVFELYNVVVADSDEMWEVRRGATAGNLSKYEFVNAVVKHESLAAERTRSFYIHMFLPWAREQGISTHPQMWYLGLRSDTDEPLILSVVSEDSLYWRAYECRYDLFVLNSLMHKGDYEKAISLADDLRTRAVTAEQRSGAWNCTGYCLLRLEKPVAATQAYSEVLLIDSSDVDALLGRASAYAMLFDMERAMADCAEAVRLEPLNPRVYRVRATLHEALGNEEAAKVDTATAMQLKELLNNESQETTEIKIDWHQDDVLSFEKGWPDWKKLDAMPDTQH